MISHDRHLRYPYLVGNSAHTRTSRHLLLLLIG